ncbi:MAG: hypothetical protein JF591_21250, partial [Lysobacter sp.]|nr:hypothetical protein [Lysobacter sp.]
HLLLVARTALIPRFASNPAEARRFLDYLLSPRGQVLLAREAKLIPARDDLLDPPRLYGDLSQRSAALRRTSLGLGFLVYLDEVKKRRFLRDWVEHLTPPPSEVTAASR